MLVSVINCLAAGAERSQLQDDAVAGKFCIIYEGDLSTLRVGVELLGTLLGGCHLALAVAVVNNAPLVVDVLALLHVLGHLTEQVERQDARLLGLRQGFRV